MITERHISVEEIDRAITAVSTRAAKDTNLLNLGQWRRVQDALDEVRRELGISNGD